MPEKTVTVAHGRERERTIGNPIFRNAHVQYILLKRVLRQKDSNFKVFKTFWRTRKAIIDGDQLFDQPDSEIAGKGLLPPWKFNFTESSLSALGASALIAALSKMFGPGEYDPSAPTLVFPFSIILKVVTILKWLLPFVPALTLFICAQAAAALSYKKDDPRATNSAKKRLQRAYLYYDGAFGLYCQFLLAIGTCVLTSGWSMFSNGTNRKAIFVTLIVGFISGAIGTIWQKRRVITRYSEASF